MCVHNSLGRLCSLIIKYKYWKLQRWFSNPNSSYLCQHTKCPGVGVLKSLKRFCFYFSAKWTCFIQNAYRTSLSSSSTTPGGYVCPSSTPSPFQPLTAIISAPLLPEGSSALRILTLALPSLEAMPDPPFGSSFLSQRKLTRPPDSDNGSLYLYLLVSHPLHCSCYYRYLF